jgi:diacylglycerol kinase (ATP)
MNKKPAGLTRLIKALHYSLSGLRHVFASEAAFRQECLIFVILLPVALLASVSRMERAVLIGSLLLVLIVEIINSALETTIDRISTETHPLSKLVKDMGSAAVLLALLNAAVTWILLLT